MDRILFNAYGKEDPDPPQQISAKDLRKVICADFNEITAGIKNITEAMHLISKGHPPGVVGSKDMMESAENIASFLARVLTLGEPCSSDKPEASNANIRLHAAACIAFALRFACDVIDEDEKESGDK